MKQTTKLLAVAALALGVLTFTKVPAVHAASLSVNSNADTQADDGECTLREAIIAVNTAAASGPTVGECAAGDGSTDTITIPAGVIMLTADLPQATESVVINGQGMGQTIIDGDEGQYLGFGFVGSGSENFALTKVTIHEPLQYGAVAVDGNFRVDEVEVYGGADKPGSTTSIDMGVSTQNTAGVQMSVEFSNLYLHDIQTTGGALNAVLLSGTTMHGGQTTASLKNITVSNLKSSTALIVNAMAISMFDGYEQNMNVDVENMTISNIEGPSTTYGIAVVGTANTGNGTAVLNARNVTINHIRGAGGPYGGVAGFAVGGVEMTNNFSATVSAVLQNVLITDVILGGSGSGCSVIDLTPVFAGTGTPSLSLSSLGGNLSDDTSCSSYFTQPTDQNNITNLSSFLEALADNGGSVPTMALKQGSPAIDAGITIAGLTTDARGIARPQGLAYDAGAYESPYTRQTTSASLASTGEGAGVVSFVALGLIAAGLVTAPVARRW